MYKIIVNNFDEEYVCRKFLSVIFDDEHDANALCDELNTINNEVCAIPVECTPDALTVDIATQMSSYCIHEAARDKGVSTSIKNAAQLIRILLDYISDKSMHEDLKAYNTRMEDLFEDMNY